MLLRGEYAIFALFEKDEEIITWKYTYNNNNNNVRTNTVTEERGRRDGRNLKHTRMKETHKHDFFARMYIRGSHIYIYIYKCTRIF